MKLGLVLGFSYGIVVGIATSPDCTLQQLTNEVEYEAIKDCPYLPGLTINPNKPMSIELKLTSLGGGLIIEGNSIQQLKLNSLETIQGRILIHNVDKLKVVEIRYLTSVIGGIKLENTDSLFQFKVPRLRSILGELEISNAQVLQELSFLSLDSITGSIKLRGLYGMSVVAFPVLTLIDQSLAITESSITQINLPYLHTLCGSIALSQLDKLSSFTIPKFQSYVTQVTIVTPSLTNLDLGKLVPSPNSTLYDQLNTNLFTKYPGPSHYKCHDLQMKFTDTTSVPTIPDDEIINSPLHPDDASGFNFQSTSHTAQFIPSITTFYFTSLSLIYYLLN